MKIFRSIALDENEAINTDNIGRSWSLCEVYAEDHCRRNHTCKTGYIVLMTEVDDSQLDWPNTLLARDRRPKEFEIVLAENINIDAYVHFSTVEHLQQWEKIEGNSGHNFFEDYLATGREYEGEITKENILELVESFA